MTFRLVGTMSLVLLLCLGAFALLMERHQDRVMAEVARTVADVGRLTLRTFELRTAAEPEGAPQGMWVQKTLKIEGKTPAGEPERVVVVTAHDGELPAGEDHAIDLDRIRVDEEPGKGLVLRIPRAHEGAGFAFHVDAKAIHGGAGAQAGGGPAWEDIAVPVPTAEYRDLFADTKRRTLLLFLGVFVVGVVVTASVGERLTRPLRRLDEAIRTLSGGNLDVKVDEGRRDEIGRVARAFNEMAARLRANRERERELTRREKLSSLGRLAAGVAHDVRNPLHAIGLTLQHLQETGRPPSAAERAPEFDRAVAIIREEIQRLDRLVENFLRFARSDRAPRVPVDVPALLRETAQLVEKEAERRGVAMEVAADPTTPPVEADAEALRSSVLNLVLNSFDAMSGGGRLVLSAAPEPGGVALEVQDSGQGIPDEDREKVFDFAWSTRDGGHGLGLAMVHQAIVEDLGGRVTLWSRVGEGTRITLHLPVLRPEAGS